MPRPSPTILLLIPMILIAAVGGLQLVDAGPAALPSAPTRPAGVAGALSPPSTERAWTADDAIATLRSRLRDRGVPDEALRGPIGASPYDPALVLPEGERATPAQPWPEGAWLVGTPIGAWWVWEYGATAAADRTALALELLLRDGRGWD